VDKSFRIIEVPIRNTDGSRSKLNIYRDITRRKDQELKLRASEQDYRRLFENVAAGVYISTKEGRFLNANQALLRCWAMQQEEFLNISIQKDLYVRPEDRLMFQRMIEEDGQVVNYPVAFKRRDGSTIPVLLTAHVRTSTGQGGRLRGHLCRPDPDRADGTPDPGGTRFSEQYHAQFAQCHHRRRYERPHRSSGTRAPKRPWAIPPTKPSAWMCGVCTAMIWPM
jgi:PAS domain S-box-containing protein